MEDINYKRLITIVDIDTNTRPFQHICHLTKNTITQLSILLYIDLFHLTSAPIHEFYVCLKANNRASAEVTFYTR